MGPSEPVAGANVGGSIAGALGNTGGQVGNAGGGHAGGGDAGGGHAGGAGAPSSLWRMSTTAYCSPPSLFLERNPIWSDARGVYLLDWNNGSNRRVSFNDGSGWKPFSVTPNAASAAQLTGFEGRRLVEYGGSPCSVWFVDSDFSNCSAAASQISHLFVVEKELAYAVYRDRLLRYDGTFWTQLGVPLIGFEGRPPYAWAVWATTDVVFVAASDGCIFRQNGEQMLLTKGVPSADNQALWGFAEDDVWAGNQLGQLLHFDGLSWRVAAQVGGDCPGIRSLWGSEGVLFFSTDHGFGRVQNDQLQQLVDYPCDGSVFVRGIWGNSSREVFVAISDDTQFLATCSGIRLQWFDGNSLRPL